MKQYLSHFPFVHLFNFCYLIFVLFLASLVEIFAIFLFLEIMVYCWPIVGSARGAVQPNRHATVFVYLNDVKVSEVRPGVRL